MEKNFVRVDPPVVEFRDIHVGQRYDIKVTAANVGKTTKKIFMEKPLSKVCYICEIFVNLTIYIAKK